MRSSGHSRLSGFLGALVAVACLTLSGCAQAPAADAPPKAVKDSALPELLLSADDLDAEMGTTGLVPHDPVMQMGDHRNLLPNLNCLGVWQVNEGPIYDPSDWQAVRQQMLRTPNDDGWNYLVVQSVVLYRDQQAAQRFFDESATRWANCSNHRVNIRLNDQQLPAWLSGELTATHTKLTMPYVRGSGSQVRSCQRALEVAANVVLDIQACKPQQPQSVSQAGEIADSIAARLPR
jgi:hypothetical protein